ncbi:MAG TPA: hypothetical protein VMY37_35820 [Thermoguttaceae bacterium]|nr:hypothetical protein [Thermoguttaceae bacterium]
MNETLQASHETLQESSETLQEFVDSRGVEMRVDRHRGVIRGVKILGTESRNGRTYLPEALREAARLYEGAKVNVNHPRGNPSAARDYQDRMGVLRSVAARPEAGLFADFHFNPKHALAEQLIWDAEHMPENVGFSHNVQARTSRRGDRVVVEAITKVQSVDLVADPATTRGLFESTGETGETGSTQSAEDQPEDHLAESGAGGSLRSTPATRSAAAAQRLTETPSEDDRPALADVSLDDLKRGRADLVEAIREEQSAEVARLRAEVDRLEASEALLGKRLSIRRLLGEFELPDPEVAQGWEKSVVSERFVESLLAAPDEAAMREMVEERAALARGVRRGHSESRPVESKPRSRDQSRVCGPTELDVKTFVEAIT